MATIDVVTNRGAREDMRELYARYAPHAHRLAFVILGDQDEASDVVQDAFVRLFGHLRDLRQPAAFEWYLRRTVVNLCRDHQRRVRAERLRDQRVRSLRSYAQEPEPEPGELMQRVRLLPERQKIAIVLHVLEDLSLEQTAELMGCSVSAIKSAVHRGMTTLRQFAGGSSRGL